MILLPYKEFLIATGFDLILNVSKFMGNRFCDLFISGSIIPFGSKDSDENWREKRRLSLFIFTYPSFALYLPRAHNFLS